MARAEAKYTIKAQDKTKGALSSVKRNLGGVDKAIGKLRTGLIALGAGAGVGSLVSFAKDAINAGDNIEKMSRRIGASVEALSQYEYVAARSGVAMTTLTMGWQRMTRRVAEAAQGMGEARDALKELRVDAVDLNKLRPEQQFEVLADALQDVKSQSDRVRLAMKLFDSEGVALVQLMGEGSAGIHALRREADELGLTLDTLSIEKMVRAKDAITKVNAQLRGMRNTIVVQLAPAIEGLANFMGGPWKQAMEIASYEWFLFKVAAMEALKTTVGWYEKFFRLLDKLTFGDKGKIAKIADMFNELGEAISNKQGEMIAADIVARTYGFTLGDVGEAVGSLTGEEVDAIATQRRYNQQIAEARRIYESTLTPLERANAAMKKATELFLLGHINLNTLIRYWKQLREELKDVGEEGEDTAQTLTDRFRDAAQSLEHSLSNAIFNAKNDLKSLADFANTVAEQIGSALISHYITGPLMESIIPEKAAGGPVHAGRPYLVGERGPELFSPGSSGTITPNNQLALAGGPPVNITVQVTAIDTQTGMQFVASQARNIAGVVQGEFNKRGLRGPLG